MTSLVMVAGQVYRLDYLTPEQVAQFRSLSTAAFGGGTRTVEKLAFLGWVARLFKVSIDDMLDTEKFPFNEVMAGLQTHPDLYRPIRELLDMMGRNHHAQLGEWIVPEADASDSSPPV